MVARRNVRNMNNAVHAASETERMIIAVRTVKLRERRADKEAKDNEVAGMSPAEKTRTQGNSRPERIRHTPSV